MGGRRRLPRSAAVPGVGASPPGQSGVCHQRIIDRCASGKGFELSVPNRSPSLVPLATKAAIAAVQEQTEISPNSGASRKRRGKAQGFPGVFAVPGSCSGQSLLGSPGCRGENRVAVTLHRPWQMAAG